MAPMTTQRRLSQVAGAAAGVMEHVAMFPVDTVKVEHDDYPLPRRLSSESIEPWASLRAN